MRTKICHVFGAGEGGWRFPRPNPHDLVIAADGGYRHLKGADIRVHLLIGDFDSLEDAPPPQTETVPLPREKDDTDMRAALQAGWDRGYRVFYLYGGAGGRLDHTLANLQCVADLAERGGSGYLFDRETVITALCNGGMAFPAGLSGTVSVFAHTDEARGVGEWGLKYPLRGAVLRNTHPLGVSNEFTGAPSRITVEQGTLLVFYPYPAHVAREAAENRL